MTDRMVLGQRLAEWLPEARWFAGKGHEVSGVSVLDVAEFPGTDVAIAMIEACAAGHACRYVTPVRMRDGSDAIETGALAEWLVGIVAENGVTVTTQGRFVGRTVDGICPANPRILSGSGSLDIRTLGGDASNSSLVVQGLGAAVAVKLIRRCEPGLQPEVEIGRFLAERVGWAGSPALRGWVAYEPADGGDPTVIATVHDFVPRCRSAWEFLGEILSGSSDSRTAIHQCVQMADAIGEITGGLHAALASRDDHPAFAPELEVETDRRATAKAMADRVERVLAHAVSAARYLPAEVAGRLERVAAKREQLSDSCRRIAGISGGQRIRVHGDYHLGQVLVRENHELLVIDFEGEPARTLRQRAEKTSPFKDVAGMCRSFDYLLRHAAVTTGRPAPAAELTSLEDAFLRAYRLKAAGHGWWPTDDVVSAELLRAWKVDKAVYELAYELDNRPDWIEVPLGALESILECG